MPIATNSLAVKEPAVLQVTPGRPAIILVVGDDLLIAMITVSMLEELGHTALQANSGKEALDLLRGENMPIILATGYAELPPGAGRNMPTLSKPFRLERLAEALAEVDAKSQGAARVVKFCATGPKG